MVPGPIDGNFQVSAENRSESGPTTAFRAIAAKSPYFRPYHRSLRSRLFSKFATLNKKS
jgi:hypothetical protein